MIPSSCVYFQTDVESDTEEDELELEGEELEFYEMGELAPPTDPDDTSDPHSSKFRAEGQLMTYEDEPSFEGYLQVKVWAEYFSTCGIVSV